MTGVGSLNVKDIKNKITFLLKKHQSEENSSFIGTLLSSMQNPVPIAYPVKPPILNRKNLDLEEKLEYLRNQKIGKDTLIEVPNLWKEIYPESKNSSHRLSLHLDYTASAQGLSFIDNYLEKQMETYANTHTETSSVGKISTFKYNQCLKEIKEHVGADEDFFILPTGFGATGAIEKIQKLLGLYFSPKGNKLLNKTFGSTLKHEFENKYVVFVGPYEHHSNDVTWQDSTLCSFVRIKAKKNSDGTSGQELDLVDLEDKLKSYPNHIKIGSFSAASNVTGIKTDIKAVSKIIKKYNGYVFLDYAASGPYEKIQMIEDDIDAIFLSLHKNLGGCNLGLLIAKESIYDKNCHPTFGGGGTVSAVSPWDYHFIDQIQDRESAGTPAIKQVWQASLAYQLKDWVGTENIKNIDKMWVDQLTQFFDKNPNLNLLGESNSKTHLPIFSFCVTHNDRTLHYALVATLLSDLFGIQSRSGCVCAGPFGHVLLDIDEKLSDKYVHLINQGINGMKPGWTRINLHYTNSKEEFEYLKKCLNGIGYFGYLFLDNYFIDMKSGFWKHENFNLVSNSISLNEALLDIEVNPKINSTDHEKVFENQIQEFCLFISYRIMTMSELDPKKKPNSLKSISKLINNLLSDKISQNDFHKEVKKFITQKAYEMLKNKFLSEEYGSYEEFKNFDNEIPFFYAKKNKVINLENLLAQGF